MPPPEPENIKAGFVFGWGFAVFGVVIASIAALGGYFWIERARAVHVKVAERSALGDLLNDLRAQETERLNGYKSLGDGRFQIPIERAMEIVAKDGL